MKLDLYTRFVLTVIALCAVLLVVRSFGLETGFGDEDTLGGRYRIAIAPPNVYRVDTKTGRFWRAHARNPVQWTLIDEAVEEEELEEDELEENGVEEEAAPSGAFGSELRDLPLDE